MKIAIRNTIWIASMVFAMSAWGQSVTVGSGQGLPGTTGIVVPVNLTAGRNIAGIDMTVTFTTAAQYSNLAVDCDANTVTADYFESCSVTGNAVRIQIADTKGTIWVDGLLANITVDVAGGAIPLVDPLVASIISAGDNGGTDLVPLPGTTDGTFTVPAGPQPVFTGTPAGLAMATEQGLANPTGSLTVTNTGEATSLLTGTCTLMGTGAPQITMSNGAFNDIAVGALGSVVGVACDAAAAGSYSDTLSCSHNGSNASPATFPVTCLITPPGAAVYSSTPAAGSTIEMTPNGPVPAGTSVPDQVLTITNGATDANDNDLALMNCGWTGSAEITATAPTSPLAPSASTMVTFSCDSASVGAYTGSYSCDYDVDVDGLSDGTASYTVNCGVRTASSDIQETPMSGTEVRFVTPIGGTGGASVRFDEVLDEGVDATVDSCNFGTADFAVVTTLPVTVAAGGSLEVMISGTDPQTGTKIFNDTLICTYTDSDSDPGTASWPVTMVVANPVPIPTLSTWGLMFMILIVMGFGGIVVRRKVHS